ncbi:hypothetical protein [Brevundimonas sp.]
MFEPPLAAKLQRKLAGMIEARLEEAEDGVPLAMTAAASAAAQLALLRVWLSGEVACDAAVLVRRLAEDQSARRQ